MYNPQPEKRPAGRPLKQPGEPTAEYNRNRPRPKPSEKLVREQLPKWDGEVRGPEPNADWSDETKAWWNVWRCSPQAMLCTETDWESMKVAALIHDRIIEGVSSTALSNLTGELRKREGMFGGTFEDRQRLGVELNTPQAANLEEKKLESEVDRAVDYFERINKKMNK